MTSSGSWSLPARAAGVAIILAASLTAVGAAPTIPDPCKLITVAELEQIVGPLKSAPKPGDIKGGDISCEYTPAKEPAWIEVRLHDGQLSAWKSRNGGKNPVSLPALGDGAFVNPDFEGSTDLYVQKGSLVLRVSMPKGPTAVDKVKAIAAKALSRL